MLCDGVRGVFSGCFGRALLRSLSLPRFVADRFAPEFSPGVRFLAFCVSLSFSRLLQPEAAGGVRSGPAGSFPGQRARGRSRFITGMLPLAECLCQVCCSFLTPHPQLSSSLRRLSACVQGLSAPVSASWAGLAGPLVRDCTRFVSYILSIPKIPKLMNFGIFGILGMCRVGVSHARSDYTDSENSKIG